MRTSRGRLVAGALIALAGLVVMAQDGPTKQRQRQILQLVPQLDGTLAEHLARDDESQWDAYAVEVGPRPFMDGWIAIKRATAGRNRSDFVRDRARLVGLMLRVADVLVEHYAYVPPAQYTR